MRTSAAFNRDANNVPIASEGLIATKTLAYDGTIGAIGASTLFTVTGTVLVRVLAVCSEDLASAGGTIEVGITGNTASLIAQITATTLDDGEIWVDNSPATVAAIGSQKILNGTSISEKITGATVTDGTLAYFCLWVPLSDDGNVVAA